MIFFLLFHFFPFIYGDCLEFLNNQSINECVLTSSVQPSLDNENYYPVCLQCEIQTLITSENIQIGNNSQCLTIDLQCIKLMFNTQELFEDFFHLHQQYIYDLFTKINDTNRNTLHIVLKENTLEEINLEYIERLFRSEHQAYRVIFFELYISDFNVTIHQNLLNISRLSIKIILNCDKEITSEQIIYEIHEHKMTLKSQQEFCSSISDPLLPTSSSTLRITTSSSELLFISDEKSKDIILIIILLTAFLLCLLITLLIYCYKRIKRHYSRLSRSMETTSESTIGEDSTMKTPLTLDQIPKLSLKVKRPLRGMRAIQFLNDDM